MEIVKSNYHYPLLNFFTFSHVGYNVNSFYPLLTLYPIAFLFKIISNPIDAFYCTQFLLLTATEICSYYSARLLKIQKSSSIMFSMVYTFSGYIAFVYWFAFELGEMLSFVVLPLLIPLTLSFIRPSYVNDSLCQYREPLLVIVLTWITFSHLLTTLICLAFLSICFLCDLIIKPSFKKLLYDIRIVLIYLLATSFYWINFFKAYLGQNITGPEKYLNIINTIQLIENSLNNSISTGNFDPIKVVSIGIIPFVFLIYIMANYSKLNNLEKCFLWLALGFLILSTNLFCWAYLKEHFLNVTIIQFTFRFLIFVVLFITIDMSLLAKPRIFEVLLLAFVIGAFNINQMSSFRAEGMRQQAITKKPSNHHQPDYANFKVNKVNFPNIYSGVYNSKGGPKDYLTSNQSEHFDSIADNVIYTTNHQRIKYKMTPKSNQVNYEFIKKENGYVDLPVLMSASKYKVYDNGHIVNNIK
ncbi:hypothetical protein [Limosilactobacillus secaliphilus]|nr:hypothetical protein [Limosilactobacillus secaliphilus]